MSGSHGWIIEEVKYAARMEPGLTFDPWPDPTWPGSLWPGDPTQLLNVLKIRYLAMSFKLR